MRRTHSFLALAGVIVIAVLAGATAYFSNYFNAATNRYALPHHQLVAEDSSFRFTFADTVNKETIEKNLIVPTEVKGTTKWEDETLVFTPAAPLVKDAVYAFALDSGARFANGLPIVEGRDYSFTVAGAPTVAVRFPAPDAKEVPTTTTAKIVFDRPVFALSAVGSDAREETLANLNITVAPVVTGHFRIVGTTAIEFVPTKGFASATHYTITVPAGITTTAGEKTTDDFSWSFETVRPTLQSSNPADGLTFASPTQAVTTTWNLPMDAVKAAKFITLAAANGTQTTITTKLGEKQKNPECVEKCVMEPDPTALVITPNTTLERDTDYVLTLAAGLPAADGDVGTAAATVVHFHTAGDFVAKNGELKYSTLFTYFSNPVDPKTLPGNVTLSPTTENFDTTTWHASNETPELSFYAELKPSTTYTVTLSTDVADIFGQKLTKPLTFTVKTEAVPSKASIKNTKGNFGMFERGRPAIVYLNDVNVSTLTVGLAPLTFADFVKYRSTYEWQTPTDFDPKTLTDYREVAVTPKGKRDEWEAIAFDVGKSFGRELTPGWYVLTLTAPEYVDNQTKQLVITRQFFAVTNLGLTLKYSGEKAFVYAVDTQTGAPITNAAVTLAKRDGTDVTAGTTDKDGFFETTLDFAKFTTAGDSPEYWGGVEFFARVEKDGDVAAVGSEWRNGLDSWTFEMGDDFRGNHRTHRVESAITTDRPVYRPGDTMSYRGILRLRDRAGKLTIPTGQIVTATIRDPEWNDIKTETLTVNRFGSVSGTFPIDAKAALGYYSINLTLGEESRYEWNYAQTNFSVLAYRKPEYRVDVTTEKSDYAEGDDVVATVEGAYYFGAPLADSKVRYRATTNNYYFNKYTGNGWYNFALPDDWCTENCGGQDFIANGETTLDTTGHATMRIPAKFANKAVSQTLVIEADVTNPNNQIVSGRAEIIVHKSRVYVGVANATDLVRPGSDAAVDLIALDPDGKPVADKAVKVILVKREWNSVKKKNVDGEYYYENEPKDTSIRDTTVTTNAEGKATAKLRVEDGGDYRVIAEATDDAGHVAHAGTQLYVWSDVSVNWPHANNDHVDVIADKPEYKVGETAHLIFKSPYAGKNVRALITTERETILTKRVITLDSTAQKIDIPITADAAPNLYVGVVILKPRDGETYSTDNLDTGLPALRVGYTKLAVETTRKYVNVTITPDKSTYGPGEEVTATIATKNFEHKPVTAEVSLAVVDESVLALTGFTAPDLVKQFYSERGLGVRTAEMWSLFFERYKPGTKGGGGADPESKKRGTFRDTAYWNPSIVTNTDGTATVKFKLPDNLTTWRFVGLAATTDHTFGTGEAKVVENKRVIVRSVRPRFAIVNDDVTFGAIVRNDSEITRTFDVTATITGALLKNDAKQTVTLKKGEEQKLAFPATIGSDERVKLTLKAVTIKTENGVNDGARDEVEESLPTFRRGVEEVVATSGMTDALSTETVAIPTKNAAEHVSLTATLSPTIATYLTDGLAYLIKYPYGCAEQTLSSFLPSVVLKTLNGFEAFRVADDKTLKDIVTQGIARMYTFQNSDGGFSYFGGSTSNPYLSAYVAYGLTLTKNAGYTVDANVMNRARGYLDGVLRETKLDNQIDLATRAYILYALSQSGGVDAALVDNLNENRAKLPTIGALHLALTLATLDAAHHETAVAIVKELENAELRIDPRGAHFIGGTDRAIWQTDEQTTALALTAELRLNPQNPLIPKLVRYLLSERQNGAWGTTQTTSATLLALTEYLKTTNELAADYTASVTANGTKVGEMRMSSATLKKQTEIAIPTDSLAGTLASIIVGKVGSGRLYYDLLLRYTPTATVAAADEGITVARELTPIVGDMKEPKVGDTYRVKLTVTIPAVRHAVAVESPLPAGFEAIDLNFKTSQQTLLAEATEAGRCTNDWSEKCWNMRENAWAWNHTELRDDTVFLFADSLEPGIYTYEYLVRATTPGTYYLRPTRAYEMYFPEIFGRTASEMVEIGE